MTDGQARFQEVLGTTIKVVLLQDTRSNDARFMQKLSKEA